MPRPKSLVRRQLSLRRWRWAVSHLVFSQMPGLARRLNFHDGGVYPSDVAETLLEETSVTVHAGFTAAQRAMVRDLCRFADAGSAATDCTGVAVFLMRTQIVREVEILGHTGAVAVPRERALIWAAAGLPSWNLAQPRRLRRVAPPQGRAVALSGTANYFHFVMNDVLPLVDYLERLHPRDVPLTVVVPGVQPDFASQILAAVAAAFPSLRIVALGASEKMPVDELVVIERRSANREWYLWDAAPMRHLKEILISRIGQSGAVPRGRRLFVSRGTARIRRILNEDDLIGVAEARGFEVFTPAPENFAAQLTGFDGASAVVSAHGAALTNLVWCRPGAQALELSPANFVKSCYLWVADRMELGHHAQLGGRGDSLLGFTVDPEKFARRLDAMLETGARGAA